MNYADKKVLEIEDARGNAYLVVKISPESLLVDLGDVVELMKEAGYIVVSPISARYARYSDGCPVCGGGDL